MYLCSRGRRYSSHVVQGLWPDSLINERDRRWFSTDLGWFSAYLSTHSSLTIGWNKPILITWQSKGGGGWKHRLLHILLPETFLCIWDYCSLLLMKLDIKSIYCKHIKHEGILGTKNSPEYLIEFTAISFDEFSYEIFLFNGQAHPLLYL